MSEFEIRLEEVYRDYVERHGKYPTSISMSFDFKNKLLNIATHYMRFNAPFGDYPYVWRNCSIKFVRRRNYIEAMPRKERRPKQKIWNPEYLATWHFPLEISQPKSMGLSNITSV